ncbi:MAG: SpoIIE family protein phosphatase [Syntrophales bacterium]
MNTETGMKYPKMERDHSDSEKMPLVNGGSKAVKFAGLFGARLRPGNIGNSTAGVGDSILIDHARGFFAVGDSSDREPRAARMFMRKFSDLLADFSVLSPKSAISDDLLDSLQKEVVSRSCGMLRVFPFQGTSTFTGLLLFRTDRRIRAVLFHTGDSVLFGYHPSYGVRRITENNFWLLGKVREFYQIHCFDVNLGERFLFATDGLQDLSPPDGKEFNEYLVELFCRYPVEDIPDILIDSCDIKTEGKDDLAILSLAPDGPVPDACGILLGGGTGA